MTSRTENKLDKTTISTTAKGGNDAEDRPTATLNGFRMLSPGAKTSQIIQIMNPCVQNELPLILDKIASTIDAARRSLMPQLYSKLPPKSAIKNENANTTIVDIAKTSVAIMGDTFEAFALVQALLDRGVPPGSIILLLPQDPSLDRNEQEDAVDRKIDAMLQGGSSAGFHCKKSCRIPPILR